MHELLFLLALAGAVYIIGVACHMAPCGVKQSANSRTQAEADTATAIVVKRLEHAALCDNGHEAAEWAYYAAINGRLYPAATLCHACRARVK